MQFMFSRKSGIVLAALLGVDAHVLSYPPDPGKKGLIRVLR